MDPSSTEILGLRHGADVEAGAGARAARAALAMGTTGTCWVSAPKRGGNDENLRCSVAGKISRNGSLYEKSSIIND